MRVTLLDLKIEIMDEGNPIRIAGLLRGSEGETQHVCWSCPACGQWYSDDYDSDLPNPYVAQCGLTRKHQTGEAVNVFVAWVRESTRDDPEFTFG